MKKIIFGLCAYLFLVGSVYAEITIDGESVHVETDRYVVEFDRGVISYIHNKLTAETYTLSPVRGTRGWTGLLKVRHFWDEGNVSTSEATLRSSSQIDPSQVELVFSNENGEVRLRIAIDSITDDLLIDIEGVSDTPPVIAAQWGCGYLDIQNLSVIAPVYGGYIIDATAPSTFDKFPYPQNWEAQLAIVQGHRGGFSVRCTDNTFQFKQLIYGRRGDGVALHFATYNQAPFDLHTTGQSQLWRFNTYAGDWRIPAKKYRDWMERTFSPTTLSEKSVDDVTLFIGSTRSSIGVTNTVFLDGLATKVDPTKTVVMLWEWADGGEWWIEGAESHKPDYFPKAGLRDFVELAHKYGFRVILGINAHAFSPTHPLYPEFQQYLYRDTWTGKIIGACLEEPFEPECDHPAWHPIAFVNPASRAYRNIIVQQLKPVWEEYGVDGFFLDTSYYTRNNANGLIDGLNSAQGVALMHKELAEAMPGAILAGERLHEATFAYESFAQRPILTTQPHPISAFLFSPFTRAISYAHFNPDQDPVYHQTVLDYSAVWGMIPTLNAWWVEQLSEPNAQKLLAGAGAWEYFEYDGDLNGDGQVNILDLVIVGQDMDSETVNYLQSDVNADGIVNVLDLVLIANMF